MAEKTAVEIRVKGKVQGVWYRASTQKKANSLDIWGVVKNEPDGSVTIKAYGHREALDQLINWCRIGPPHARVEDVQWSVIDWQPSIASFQIKR